MSWAYYGRKMICSCNEQIVCMEMHGADEDANALAGRQYLNPWFLVFPLILPKRLIELLLALLLACFKTLQVKHTEMIAALQKEAEDPDFRVRLCKNVVFNIIGNP